MEIKDYIGKKYGHITIISFSHKGHHSERYFLSRCDCGKEKIRKISAIKKNSVGCGCFHKYSEYSKKHNLSNSRLYEIHHQFKKRCGLKSDSSYKNYGGRGIVVCDEWLGNNGFINFYNWAMNNGYNDCFTIDRINNDGNYEPSNCRWATKTTQMINQRINSRNNSGYKGVCITATGQIRVYVSMKGRKRFVYYKANTIEEAVNIRNKYIQENNLPHKIQEYIND